MSETPCSEDQVQQVLGGGEESPRHPLHSLCGIGIWYSRRLRHGFFDKVGQAGIRMLRDACGQVAGLLAPKGFSRRSCRSRGEGLALIIRRRRRCGGRFFLGGDAFSCNSVFHPPCHGPQASPCLSPPLVASTCCILSVAKEFP
jgi:hypothetical protein